MKCWNERQRRRIPHWVKSRAEKANSSNQLFGVCLSLVAYADPHTNSAKVLDPARFHSRGSPRAGEKSSLGCVHTEASLENTRSRGIAILNQPIAPSSLVSLPPAVAKPWSFRGRQPSKCTEHLAWEKYSSQLLQAANVCPVEWAWVFPVQSCNCNYEFEAGQPNTVCKHSFT